MHGANKTYPIFVPDAKILRRCKKPHYPAGRKPAAHPTVNVIYGNIFGLGGYNFSQLHVLKLHDSPYESRYYLCPENGFVGVRCTTVTKRAGGKSLNPASRGG
jgi:hypothetical protein